MKKWGMRSNYEMFETLFGKDNRPLELRENFFYRIQIAEFADREIVSLGYRPDALRVTTHVEYRKSCVIQNSSSAAPLTKSNYRPSSTTHAASIAG